MAENNSKRIERSREIGLNHKFKERSQCQYGRMYLRATFYNTLIVVVELQKCVHRILESPSMPLTTNYNQTN